MALIMDNKYEREDYIVMVDDGYGSDVKIPTVMISEYDGEELLKYLKSQDLAVNSSVALSVKFSLP
jgi:hypothetical protein